MSLGKTCILTLYHNKDIIYFIMTEFGTHRGESDRMSRRALMLGGVSFLAGIYLLDKAGDDDKKHGKGTIEADTSPKNEAFDSADANEVAAGLLIDRTSYWKTTTETMSAIMENSRWEEEDSLLPIYPAAVMDYEDAMKKVADELDIPINIVAIIASIESAGLTHADSGPANGLFQVVPSIHFDRIDRVAVENGKQEPVDEAERIKVLQDPYMGCRIGMEILLEYRDEAIRNNAGLRPESPIIWARALASYNGGPSNAGKQYSKMPLESQLYAMHAIRYITDAAVASGLRQDKGMSDQEIHDAMTSKQVDRDTYAYSEYIDQVGGMDSIQDYELVWSTIAGDNQDKRIGGIVKEARRKFDKGESGYKLPLTPALRIWTAHGGLSLLRRVPKNNEPEAYKY